MSDKLIIQNDTDRPITEIMDVVSRVIAMGRISETGKGEQYCFHCRFESIDGIKELHVSSFKNAKSDRFIVWERSISSE